MFSVVTRPLSHGAVAKPTGFDPEIGLCIIHAQTDTVPAVKRNVLRWGCMGAAAGAFLGLIFGLAFTTPGRFGFWMAVLAPTLFFGVVSAFTAGSRRSGRPRRETNRGRSDERCTDGVT